MNWIYWQTWVVSLVWLWFIYRSVWKTNEYFEEGEISRGWHELRTALVMAPIGTIGALVLFCWSVANHLHTPLVVFAILVVIGLALTINSARLLRQLQPHHPRRMYDH